MRLLMPLAAATVIVGCQAAHRAPGAGSVAAQSAEETRAQAGFFEQGLAGESPREADAQRPATLADVLDTSNDDAMIAAADPAPAADEGDTATDALPEAANVHSTLADASAPGDDGSSTELAADDQAAAPATTSTSGGLIEETGKAVRNAPERAQHEVNEDAAKVNAAKRAVTPKVIPASIESIDRNAQQITFRVRENERAIQLQAGHEFTVDFASLPALTGMKQAEALAKMRAGQDVDLKVIGSGGNAKVTSIRFGDF